MTAARQDDDTCRPAVFGRRDAEVRTPALIDKAKPLRRHPGNPATAITGERYYKQSLTGNIPTIYLNLSRPFATAMLALFSRR